MAFTDGGPWNADAAPFASPGFLAATGWLVGWLLVALAEVSNWEELRCRRGARGEDGWLG